MWTLSMQWWAYSLNQSTMMILSPAPIKHKGWGKSWLQLNKDLRSDSEVKKKKEKKKKGLSTAW